MQTIDKQAITEAWNAARQARQNAWNAAYRMAQGGMEIWDDPEYRAAERATGALLARLARELGSEERIQRMVACGMSEERAAGYDDRGSMLISDEAAMSEVATWIFDQIGFARWMDGEMNEAGINSEIAQKVKAVWPEAYQAWLDGNHDT